MRLIDQSKKAMYKMNHMLTNSPLNIANCCDNLLKLDDILRSSGIRYWLSEGTALGVVRDQSLILWDDDVDISFMSEYKERFIEHSLPRMLRCGFVLANVEHDSNFLSFVRNGEIVDIDIVEKDGRCMAGFTKNAQYTTECNSIIPYLRKLYTVRFLDRDFLVPGDEYFEFLYSKTWKTPMRTNKLHIESIFNLIRRSVSDV
jgi:hypothetical protein